MTIPNMPNFPHMQVMAFLAWIASQAVAYGWLKHGVDQQTLSIAATAVAIGLAWADSHLRGKRVIAHAILNSPAPISVDSSGTATTTPLVTPVIPAVSSSLGT